MRIGGTIVEINKRPIRQLGHSIPKLSTEQTARLNSAIKSFLRERPDVVEQVRRSPNPKAEIERLVRANVISVSKITARGGFRFSGLGQEISPDLFTMEPTTTTSTTSTSTQASLFQDILRSGVVKGIFDLLAPPTVVQPTPQPRPLAPQAPTVIALPVTASTTDLTPVYVIGGILVLGGIIYFATR